ncbi:MAG: MATE family efflux transporter [Coriobacteriia bacterium]|nr:MATE family efflux transporter [Coriobacteriia bacterium]
MGKTEDGELLTAPPFTAIAGLAVPIALSSLLEQLYNMADSIIAGNFLGENAVAAVGASFSLCNVLVYAALGCGIGAGVLTARRFGEGARDEASAVIWTSAALFTLTGTAIGVAGLPLAEFILEALGTPAEATAPSRGIGPRSESLP